MVVVPDAGVVVFGDCFYPLPYHLRRPGDGVDGAVIGRLLAIDAGTYVGEQGDPLTGEELRALTE